MYDQQLLKEKYGFSVDTYGGGWANYLKALYRTNTDLYKYDKERIKNLYNRANKCFCKELFWIGMEDEIIPDMICAKQANRRVKLSFTKIDAILMGK